MPRRPLRPARPALALLGICFAGAAFAGACPGPGDLARGIEITDDAGLVEVFRQHAPGVVLSLITGTDFELHALLKDGVYLMESGPSHQGNPAGFQRMILDLSDAALPAPAPGASFSAEVPAISSLGSQPVRIDYAFGAATALSIGACSFETVPVTMTFPGEQPPYFEELAWFPALGLSRVTARGLVAEGPPTQTSQAVSIRVLP